MKLIDSGLGMRILQRIILRRRLAIHLWAVEQQPVGVEIRESLQDLDQEVESRFVSSGDNMRDCRRLYFENFSESA